MIAIQDLRIGNLGKVTFNKEESGFGKDYIDTIEAIQTTKVLVSKDHHWQPIDSIDPIQITEDWLIKLGFHEKTVPGCVSEYVFNFEDLIELNWDSDDGLLIYELQKGGDYSLPHIKYIHQLQNIFYFLTNKELTIKQ